MPSRYAKIDLTKSNIPMPSLEAGTEVGRDDLIETIDSAANFSVTDRIGEILAQSSSMEVICTIKDITANLGNEIAKHAIDRREIRIVIQMLKLNVENDRVFGLVKPKRPITLVPFRYEVLSIRIPMRVGAENW